MSEKKNQVYGRLEKATNGLDISCIIIIIEREITLRMATWTWTTIPTSNN